MADNGDLREDDMAQESIANGVAALTLQAGDDDELELWDEYGEKSRKGAPKLVLIGARVCYYRSGELGADIIRCDHPLEHNDRWKKALTHEGCLEAGSIVDYDQQSNSFQVKWDCGVKKWYPESDWSSLKTYDLAPTGNPKLNVIWCDACLLPVMGYAFRLASGDDDDEGGHPTTADKFYDLCYKCYNINTGRGSQFLEQQFRCNLPSDDIAKKERPLLVPRGHDKLYQLLGLFPRSLVKSDGIQGEGVQTNSAQDDGVKPDSTQTSGAQGHRDGIQSVATEGTIVRIVHEDGMTDMRLAGKWRCYAEIDPKLSNGNGSKRKQLTYCALKDLSAIKPGVDKKSQIYIKHFPSVGHCMLMKEHLESEIFTESVHGRIEEFKCFKRYNTSEGNKYCWSLTITGSQLSTIKNVEIWSNCHGKLRVCNLHMNKLTDLPIQLRHSNGSLHLLCIQSNSFLVIPEELFKFADLYYLNMHDNYISRVPENIKKLSALTHLYIGKNNLRFLPDVFDNLPCLLKISFTENKLTRLPSSFSSLQRLHTIDLSHNKFCEVPSVLLKLKTSLRSLRMQYNSIQKIGPIVELDHIHQFLDRLSYINLSGNPLQCCELLSVAPKEMVKHLSNSKTLEKLNKAPLRKSLRILLVGNSGAGKTSVAEALGLKKYVTPTSSGDHDHTIGINRYTVPIQVDPDQGNPRTIELILWDFAGEEHHIPMHNIFLSDITIVFIVVNLETYECTDECYHACVGNWIRPIMMRSTKPAVWVVPTHIDKCSKLEIEIKIDSIILQIQKDCDRLTDEVQAKIRFLQDAVREETDVACIKALEAKRKYVAKVINVPKYIWENLQIHKVANTYYLEGIDDLKNAVSRLLAQGLFCGSSELRREWVAAADRLQKTSEDLINQNQPPLISKEQTLDLIQQCIPDGTQEENEEFLRYLQQKGDILPLGAGGGRIILDVKWLIQILQDIFRHEFDDHVKKLQTLNESTINTMLGRKNESGLVEVKLLQALWSVHGVSIHREMIQDIVKLLIDFRLACKVNDDYFFPWLISKNSSLKELPDCNTATITVEYEFSFSLPISFFETFVAYCMQLDCFENCRMLKLSDQMEAAPKSHAQKAFSADYGTVPVAAFYEPNISNRYHGTIRLCAFKNNGESIIEVWKGFMNLVQQLEVALSEQSSLNDPNRFILCPGCVKAQLREPKKYKFEYDSAHSGKRTYYHKKGLNLVCNICKNIQPPENLAPPEDQKLDALPIASAGSPKQPKQQSDASGKPMLLAPTVIYTSVPNTT